MILVPNSADLFRVHGLEVFGSVRDGGEVNGPDVIQGGVGDIGGVAVGWPCHEQVFEESTRGGPRKAATELRYDLGRGG